MDLMNAITGESFDMRDFITQRILARISADMQREEARIVYGTLAIKQGPSRHAQSRRDKRRARKGR